MGLSWERGNFPYADTVKKPSGLVKKTWFLGMAGVHLCYIIFYTMSQPLVLNEPIDQMDPSFSEFFGNLQGNILKGHGRNHTTHIFIHFDANRVKQARQWISSLELTSCRKQLAERERFKRNNVPGDTFTSLLLSAAGYRYLGFEAVDEQLTDPAFQAGMQLRTAITNDPQPDKWEKGFREKIHAMLLIADHDPNRMAGYAKTVLEELDKFARITTVEYGNAIRNANGDGLEHFGYVDGISQPLFFKDEVEAYMQFHSTNAQDARFNPAASPQLVLVADPFAENPDAFGSYFVFRKLEQNVKGFKKAEEAIGKALFPDDKDEEKRELAGAYLVGRFEDGSPVTLTHEEGMIGSGAFNNFNYNTDTSGGRCPFFAHIRKTNPRHPGDEQRTMARRGIPFGHREVDPETNPIPLQMPEDGVGLLFMSYQQSLTDQFEFIQQSWANNADFEQSGTGVDPIIGQTRNGSPRTPYHFPEAYGQPEPGKDLNFKAFVSMKGGEYFFAPSIPFLKSL